MRKVRDLVDNPRNRFETWRGELWPLKSDLGWWKSRGWYLRFEGGEIVCSRECSESGVLYSVSVPESKMPAIQNLLNGTGDLIQNSLPDLSEEEREFLISGTTPMEWEALFVEE